ncbi:MAG: hypothetical protein Q8R91_04520 [Candidatus Omnitrophota bacterium]|nr:hypothetical protein [Candidatus Omnitrophota bacterium]
MRGTPRGAHERYGLQWGAVGLLVVGAALWVWDPPRRLTSWFAAPRVSSEEGVDWFLVIRIPEVPSDEQGAAAAGARLRSWLGGLREAGFHPTRLSTVLSRRDQGLRLPRKTVVLLFHPGHRRTADILAPLLAAERCPAVWLTDEEAIRRSDRRYLSRHAVRQMQQSGLWDVAWHRGSSAAEIVAVDLTQDASRSGAAHRLTLNLRVGHQALNQLRGGGDLVRLNADPTWTAQDLVARLLTEAPVEGPAYLTARRIGSRIWGVALDADASDHQQPFGLEAPLSARAASVAWPCTVGTPDLLLHVKMLARSGETWVSLRSDRSSGQGVRVGFTEEGVRVQQGHGQATPLAAVPWPASVAERLSATMVLRGPRLHLLVNDERVLSLDVVGTPAASNGIVELAASDRVRGAAKVELASLVFVPLSSSGSIRSKTTWPLQAPGFRSLLNVGRGDVR